MGAPTCILRLRAPIWPGEILAFWALLGPVWKPNVLEPPAWYIVDSGVQFAAHSTAQKKLLVPAGNFGFLGPAGPRLPNVLEPPAWYVVDPGAQFAARSAAQKELLVPAGNFGFLGPAGPHLVHCLEHKQPSLLWPAALYVVDPRAQFAMLHAAQKTLLVPAGNFGFWGPSGLFGVLILWVP
ncbi:hypothetical protein C8R44DRAFT_753416 [Mycena epipterygia]|nr:hypothetical protein C8R44DRAFT_753416 [Mycena epipterygia]